MSDENAKSGWHAFHEKQVLIQFKEQYIGVNAEHKPALRLDERKQPIAIITVPYLAGTLEVLKRYDLNGDMLLLHMPIEGTGNTAIIEIDPEVVAFCTHIPQSRIVSQ